MAGAVTKPQHLQRGLTRQVKYFICLSPYFCITLNVPLCRLLYTSEEETPDNDGQTQPVAWIFRL